MNDFNDHQLTYGCDEQTATLLGDNRKATLFGDNRKAIRSHFRSNEHLLNGFHFLLNYLHKLSE